MLQLVLVWCCPGLAGSWGGSSGNLFTPPKKLILGPTCSRDPQFSVLSLWAGGSPSTGDKKNLLPHCWEFPAPFFFPGNTHLDGFELPKIPLLPSLARQLSQPPAPCSFSTFLLLLSHLCGGTCRAAPSFSRAFPEASIFSIDIFAPHSRFWGIFGASSAPPSPRLFLPAPAAPVPRIHPLLGSL